jgi:ATP-dependent Clp protease adaptor protein ClpS
VASTQTQTKPEIDTDQPVPWNVVLLNDDDHDFDYVIRMVQELFGHTKHKAELIAKTVDREKRAVCLTTHKEHAELKRDQIHAYGHERLGPMSAIIEPAEFGGEDDGTGDDETPMQ